MKTTRVISPALAVAIAAALSAPARPAPAATDASAAEFRKLDLNRDGYLGRDEARAIPGFDRPFTEADDNRDGRLDAGEFIKAQAIHDRMRAGRFVEDSVITARVKAALLQDDTISALEVSVETHKGTVLLSGFVDRQSQAHRAAEIAAGVPGVIKVESKLIVKS